MIVEWFTGKIVVLVGVAVINLQPLPTIKSRTPYKVTLVVKE